jgi:YHS domain-containing protein
MGFTGRIIATVSTAIIIAAGFLFAQTGDSSIRVSEKGKKHVTATPDTAKKDTSTAKKTLASQTTCPVMGGAVNKKLFVDYKGKRIYVCCPGCIDELKSNPEKYIKILADMGQGVEVLADMSKTPGQKTGTKAKK